MAATLTGLRFLPLHHADRLDVVNPEGDVGLITLWSPVRTVRRKLEAIAPALLDPAGSRIAAIANLYGDGLLAMFCNLLYNPQIRHLVAVGEDLGLSTCREIDAFLRDGLEDVTMLGVPHKRVRGTDRIFPDVPGFDAEPLRATLTFRAFGKVSRVGVELPEYVAGLPRVDEPGERVRVDLPAADEYAYRPSHVAAHQVVRARPLDAWEELVVRCVRFGRRAALAKGERIELRDAKVVITDPADDPECALAAYGFSPEAFRAYQQRILEPALPEDIGYSYGNRLRAHFGHDALATAIAALREDPETRHAYVALWDTARDPIATCGGRGRPCLTTVFLRRDADGRLALSATYRAHNLLTAWLENVYGLMAVQRHVAAAVAMEPGSITVLSHSLGVDPASPRFGVAVSLADGRTHDHDLDRDSGKRVLREDPHGYFVVSTDRDRGLVVAEHRFGGVLVKRYEAARGVTIEQAVAADQAVSLVSHALWLGRELAKAEQALR